MSNVAIQTGGVSQASVAAGAARLARQSAVQKRVPLLQGKLAARCLQSGCLLARMLHEHKRDVNARVKIIGGNQNINRSA